MIVNKIIVKLVHLSTFSVYTNVYGFLCVKDKSSILDTFGANELRPGPLWNVDLLPLH